MNVVFVCWVGGRARARCYCEDYVVMMMVVVVVVGMVIVAMGTMGPKWRSTWV